jgi:hypothetical protein
VSPEVRISTAKGRDRREVVGLDAAEAGCAGWRRRSRGINALLT